MDMYLDINQACKQNSNGFTLVELSIVIVIVGLIVAGVTAGKSLVRQAGLRSLITEKNTYQAAYNSFKLQYNAIPGDMQNAFTYWSTCGGGVAATCNGDGNKLIEWGGKTEDYKVWNHLSLAKLIPGNYNGLPGSCSVINTNIPKSKFGSDVAVGIISASDHEYTNFKDLLRHHLYMGRINCVSDTRPWMFFLTVPEAYNIDLKLDNGLPGIGSVKVRPFGASTLCASSTNAAIATYVTNNSGYNCNIIFMIEG